MAVLLSLNTGLRRGELFSLKWKDIDLGGRFLTVTAGNAKTDKTRRIQLNSKAIAVLREWRTASGISSEHVFAKRDQAMRDARTSFERLLSDAKITDFTWHDMRHHFASRLVQAGVDLYRVKELLGHSSSRVTERYAHLKPEQLHEAVERLCGPEPLAEERETA